MNTTFIGSYPTHSIAPKDGKPEFAFIGRSNVGKSSLINMLSAQDGLAKVSQTPGKTQMLNFFDVDKKWYLVDLPGYGFAKTPKAVRAGFGKMISDYFSKRETIYCAFLLIDSNVPPQDIDLDFADFLGECRVPFTIVFTKTDKQKKGVDIPANIQKFKERMLETWETVPLCIESSALRRFGRDEILHLIENTLK
jgi:GTP-binding protein